MTVRRQASIALMGAVIVAAGFLVGSSLGDNPGESQFGSAPETLTDTSTGTRVPKYASENDLPELAVTTTEVATTETSASEQVEPVTESSVAAPIVDEPKEEKKEESKAPPPTLPSSEPGVTVGGEE